MKIMVYKRNSKKKNTPPTKGKKITLPLKVCLVRVRVCFIYLMLHLVHLSHGCTTRGK